RPVPALFSTAPWPARSGLAANNQDPAAHRPDEPRRGPCRYSSGRVCPTTRSPPAPPRNSAAARHARTLRFSRSRLRSGSRRGALSHIGLGTQLTHSDVTLAATSPIHDLADQLTTGRIDIFATRGAHSDVVASLMQLILETTDRVIA